MNHYERLKVSPDAPPEVIRAAYRALATKLHPDRQGGNAGPNEEAHEAMSALNASYLVLTNEKARQNYDAQLRAQREGQSRPATGAFQTSAFRTSAFQATGGGGPHTHGGGAATDAPDIDWLHGKQQGHAIQNAPIPNWAWALLVSSLATAAVMGWMVWNRYQRSGVDALMMKATASPSSRVASGVVLTPRDVSAMLPGVDPTLAEQIAKAAAGTGVDDPAAATASAPQSLAASMPTLASEELDKLSNEELLARTQQILGGQTPPGMAGAKTSKASLATAANGMTSTDATVMLAKPASSRLLEGAQGLSLKISPSARMGSVPSSQP